MRGKSGVLAAVLIMLAVGGGCAERGAPQAAVEGKRMTFRLPVIGYLPDYRLAGLDPAVGGEITDLVYFSIEPKPSGELDLTRLPPQTVAQLQAIQRRSAIRLHVALGGWSRSTAFGPMASDPAARGRCVEALTRLCVQDQLDGADFDWEHPANDAEEAAYAQLVVETARSFHSHGLLLSVALAPWQKLAPDAVRAVDRIHLMSYDHDGRHSTLADAEADVERLISAGVDRKKLCLGVPFYGRDVVDRNQDVPYSEIVRQYHPAPDVDQVGTLYFNGPKTIQQKARYALDHHLGGVMIWELGQDTTDANSLLKAIDQVVCQ